jgi:hypothetical protein
MAAAPAQAGERRTRAERIDGDVSEHDASGAAQSQPTRPAKAAERRAPYFEFRRYINVGGMFGNLAFLVGGVFVGFFYGGIGGTRFFEELFLIKQVGSLATLAGSVLGVLMGLVCVWAICVVVFACGGAMLFWARYRRWPPPPAR